MGWDGWMDEYGTRYEPTTPHHSSPNLTTNLHLKNIYSHTPPPYPSLAGISYFFPNIIFTMIRSHHPPHQAVFRVPVHLNKIDIKNYLEAMYKVNVTDVRTMVYSAYTSVLMRERIHARYKKAIVSMKEDFVFPPVDRELIKEHKMKPAFRGRRPGRMYNQIERDRRAEEKQSRLDMAAKQKELQDRAKAENA